MVFRVRSIVTALGFLIGAYLGLSAGIVISGEAGNTWWFFAFLFAAIGWVVSAPVARFVVRIWARRGDQE